MADEQGWAGVPPAGRGGRDPAYGYAPAAWGPARVDEPGGDAPATMGWSTGGAATPWASAGPQPPSARAPAQRMTFSVLAMVCGCAAVVVLPLLVGSVAIILGLVAVKKRQPYGRAGLGVGVAGLLLGSLLATVLFDIFV